jgi:hypothetical protein
MEYECLVVNDLYNLRTVKRCLPVHSVLWIPKVLAHFIASHAIDHVYGFYWIDDNAFGQMQLASINPDLIFA